MNTIKLTDIIIPESFKNHYPAEYKLNKVRDYYNKNGKIDRPVVLDGQTLTDGYVRYLVAKELCLEEINYVKAREYNKGKHEEITEMPLTYIVGKFNGCNKEYTWKVTKKNLDIEVGDLVLVKTSNKDCRIKSKNNGKQVVTVVEVFTSDNPSLLRHKPVIKKLQKKADI